MKTPYPYQQDAAERLARREIVGLWMSAGTGKTVTAELAWKLAGCPAPCLIVTKAVGRHVWARDAAWVLPGERVSELWAGSARSKSGRHRDGTFSNLRTALNWGRIISTNYEILKQRRDELLAVPWKCLIFDESHSLKQGYCTGPKAVNRWTLAMDLSRAVHNRRGYVWELTATPIRDRVRDLWGQLTVVLPHEWNRRSRWGFLKQYCDAHEDAWGHWDTRGKSNTKELAERLAKHFVVLRRADVAAELPAVTRDVRLVDTSENLSREYMGGGVEMAITRAAALKEDTVTELALEYLAGGGKAVVVTSRRALAAKLFDVMTKACSKELPRHHRETLYTSTVTGEVEVRHRVELIRRFNDYTSGPALLVATTDSLLEAVDIHQADALIVTALPYTPAQIIQLEGRLGRLGGRPCTIHYLVAEGTIDEQVRSLLLDKLETVEQVGTDTQGGAGAAAAISGAANEDEILAGLSSWLETTAGEE